MNNAAITHLVMFEDIADIAAFRQIMVRTKLEYLDIFKHRRLIEEISIPLLCNASFPYTSIRERFVLLRFY